MHLAGVSFTIGVIQDSPETARHFSGDVPFTAAEECKVRKKQRKPFPL